MGYKDIEKQRKFQRKRCARNRREWFIDKYCVRCGSVEQLELDHINPKDKITHNVWSWSPQKRKEELAKCQVLCRDHHKEKTRKDMGYGLKHGTENGYGYYKCRCDECRLANTVGQRSRRKKYGRSPAYTRNPF